MATEPYRPLSWSGDEPILDQKMNQAMSNIQWVYENMPRMYYNAYGLKKTAGLKILAGVNIVPKNNLRLSTTTVYFGTFFSQGCRPVVVATPNPTTGRTRFQMVVGGIGTTYPDNRGCVLKLTTDEYASNVNSNQYATPVNWIAVGW